MSRLQIPTTPSSVPPPEPPLQHGDRLDQPTFHRRYLLTPEHVKAELIEGVVYMASPLKLDHGDRHVSVGAYLVVYAAYTPGTKATDNSTTILGPASEPQPDASLRVLPEFGGQSRRDADGYLVGPPELIVEIADSSRSIDLNAKRRDYERGGAQEYLVVVVPQQRFVWFVRRDGAFVELPPGPDGVFRSEFFDGLWLDPVALFRNDDRAQLELQHAGLASPEHAATVARLQAARTT